MKGGVIQQVDRPMNLYRYPRNRFIATFIGSPAMNMLPVKVFEKPGVLVLKCENGLKLRLSPKEAETISVLR
ncbi:hypothetical protein [Desulfopila sp. IMCC35008]|uniref:hypothetical protein n=1 Tax=Desulfopila sp. IMCC35008 TaxID=2653858 RepID=UPI0013D09E17|nr:hypothetical protein [Desulfopila sp. IMCC35008]